MAQLHAVVVLVLVAAAVGAAAGVVGAAAGAAVAAGAASVCCFLASPPSAGAFACRLAPTCAYRQSSRRLLQGLNTSELQDVMNCKGNQQRATCICVEV